MTTLAFAPTAEDLAARFFDIPSNMARLDIGQRGFLAEDADGTEDVEDGQDAAKPGT